MADADRDMDNFYRELESKNMDALWRGRSAGSNSASIVPYPPCHWKWSDILPFLDRAGQLVEPGPDAERRVIQLINPALSASRAASHTLTANVQLVLPGETAPSHRHTNNAIRFILEGSSAVTIVNGEPIEMNPGDLVLTPGMQWHGHINTSDGPSIWMDTLDRPLIASLRQVFQESLKSTGEIEALTTPAGTSWARFGNGYMRPISMRTPNPFSPLSTYPWARTEEALYRLAKIEADPFDDVCLDYTNPTTGGHVLPTIGCRIQLLRAGVHTRAHRHSYASVYHVFRGSGSTIVDGVQIAWAQGDFFVLPPQCWHEHINSKAQDAVLFSTTDAPVLEALQLYKGEAYPHGGGHQSVTANYTDRGNR
jgi:gentisate 1,2-dioxygenase